MVYFFNLFGLKILKIKKIGENLGFTDYAFPSIHNSGLSFFIVIYYLFYNIYGECKSKLFTFPKQ